LRGSLTRLAGIRTPQSIAPTLAPGALLMGDLMRFTWGLLALPERLVVGFRKRCGEGFRCA